MKEAIIVIDKIKKLKNSYYNWVTKEIQFNEINDSNEYIVINTPFVDQNFDNINIYVKFIDKDTIELSDWGYTLFNLEDSGVNLSKRSKTVWKILNQTVTDFGISLSSKNVLSVKSSLKKFPIAKSRLLQAMMRIDDIQYLNKKNIKSSFNDLLTEFFEEKNILFSPNIEVPTINGISSHFDFSIPKSKGEEQLIKTVSRNDINAAKIFNYDVSVTSPVRQNSKFILLVDDYNHLNGISDEMKTIATEGLSLKNTMVLGFAEIKKKDIISN